MRRWHVAGIMVTAVSLAGGAVLVGASQAALRQDTDTDKLNAATFTRGAAASTSASQPATHGSAVGAALSQPGCCGKQMQLDGPAWVYKVENPKMPDGTVIPEELQTEVYGEELAATTTLSAGTYTVVITASENSFQREGKRLFNVIAISGGRGPAPADPKGDSGTRTAVATDVDLFKIAGGAGRLVTLKATIKHGGGPLRILFTAQADNAKFSAVKILDAEGNKAAWLFAEDVAELLRLPDAPPDIPGPIIYKDVSQPMEKRAADLVRRMTLREKVGQMQHGAPAIERLGVPAYNYWSEGLHGVARNGYATVFPQAIGMSASFDAPLLRDVADAISTEARAKWAAFQAQGGVDLYGGYYRGLTFWSPNINLFRDPRWGRGQETYGEDPVLTGTMAVQFIQGMQGNDPKYYKVIATAKHFAVHSGPEPDRHIFNAAPPIRDFYESYLPHFEMAVREGKCYSVMGAYNRVYGSPACESDLLLKKVLRQDWGFQGYVVSDCDAITDIWKNHMAETDHASAAAGAVLAGCDLECGGVYRFLPLAVDRNLIGEGAIDQSLTRVFLSRFKLGLFDPPAAVPYSSIRAEQNATPANQALALKMARESMVLLKNDGALPLKTSARKIAVVGPNADTIVPLLGNYNGTPTTASTVLDGIKAAYRGQIVSVRGCDNAARTAAWQIVPDVCWRPVAGSIETGLKAEHFESEDLSGPARTVRTEKAVDVRGLIEWSLSGVPTLAGSSRWSGEFVAPVDGVYKLAIMGSTPHRLKVDGTTVEDTWDPAAATAATATADQIVASKPGEPAHARELVLKAGDSVSLVLEAHQATGYLDLQLVWNRGDMDLSAQAAKRVADADAIIFVGGYDGHMEAEENDSRGIFTGFNNGDRLDIEMPASQEQLLKALVATGKPVIFVNMSGSAVAMPWAKEHASAIMQAWYPGQAGGTAIADVLFGTYNPSGRLPVTFYRSTKDLPAFTDYAMKDRTYRFFTGEPLWPFGYGLSYTTFKYGTPTLDKPQATAADTLSLTLDVSNAGTRDGDEVVELFARQAKPAPGDAVRRLVGFTRVSLPAGKTAKIQIPVPIARLRNWDIQKQSYVVPTGEWILEAGGSSADIRSSATITVK